MFLMCTYVGDFIHHVGIIIKLTLLQIQIVNVLWETAHLPKASYDFSNAHGILTWILQLTERR